MAFKMKNPSMAKLTKAAGDNRSAMKMKMEEKAAAAKMKKEAAMKMDKESMAKLKEKASAMKMKKSPMEKELVGKQHNLPEELKAKIEAAPSKMRNRKGAMDTESPMKKDDGLKVGQGMKLTRTDEYKDYLKRKKEFMAEQGHGHDAAYSDFKGKKFHKTIFNMDGSPVDKEAGSKKPPTKMKKGESGTKRPKYKKDERKEKMKNFKTTEYTGKRGKGLKVPGTPPDFIKGNKKFKPLKMKGEPMKMSHKK